MAAPVLEYDVPRPPSVPERLHWPGEPASGPLPSPEVDPAAERHGTAAPGDVQAQESAVLRASPQLDCSGSVGFSQASTDGDSESNRAGTAKRNGSPPTADGRPRTLNGASGDALNGHSAHLKGKCAEKLPTQSKTGVDISFEEQEMQMNAILAELLGNEPKMPTDKPKASSTPSRWQDCRQTVSSTRPRSDNVDSCESSPMTSPCSSQRLSDSTSSSWMMAPPVSRVVAPPVSRVVALPASLTVTSPACCIVAPPVCLATATTVWRRTLLRLNDELLNALQRVQERRRCPSREAATLSFQLNVARLRCALWDLLQFIDCTAETEAVAGLERTLAPLREASRQLELGTDRQEAVGWESGPPADSAGVGDGMGQLQAAVRTLAAHLPLSDRPRSGRGTSWGSENRPTSDQHSPTGRRGCLDSWLLTPSAQSADGSSGRARSDIISDKTVTAFYLNQCETHQSLLRQAVERLMRSANDPQRRSVLPVLCKFVVLSAHRLVVVGDGVGGGVEDHKTGWRILTASDQLFIALRRTLSATKAVALGEESDSSDAVREMAEATQTLTEAAEALVHSIVQQLAASDAKRMIWAKSGAR